GARRHDLGCQPPGRRSPGGDRLAELDRALGARVHPSGCRTGNNSPASNAPANGPTMYSHSWLTDPPARASTTMGPMPTAGLKAAPEMASAAKAPTATVPPIARP